MLSIRLQDNSGRESEFALTITEPGELTSRRVVSMCATQAALYEELEKETLALAGQLWAKDEMREAEAFKELARKYKGRARQKREQQMAERKRFEKS